MKSYRPSNELLATCGFRPSPAAGQWCHFKGVHMHYFEPDHALEVYNGLPHPFFRLTSTDDETFRAEVQALESASTIQ